MTAQDNRYNLRGVSAQKEDVHKAIIDYNKKYLYLYNKPKK